MINLLLVTLIWSFSFSLISNYIIGGVDTYIAILIRFSLALLIFLPFLKRDFYKDKDFIKVIFIGAVQIGLMYISYFNSFKYLKASEIALLTTTTPIYVYLGYSLWNRSFSLKALPAILGVILGAMVIKRDTIDFNYFIGILLTQSANICFALGQVLYKKWFTGKEDGRSLFAGFYMGSLIVIIPLSLFLSDFSKLPSTSTHFIVLGWLGLIASGLGYYLWNEGAKKVNAQTLAYMNNAVIPLAIFVDFLFWDSSIDWTKYGTGLAIMLISGALLNKIKEKTQLVNN